MARKRKTGYEFSGKPVRPKDIQKILEAGRWAPSSHNSQPWRFVVIQNKKTIDQLLATCYYDVFHSNPSTMIAIVAEPIYAKQKGLLQGSFKEFAPYHQYLNLGFPVLNMVYAAMELGIQSCILSPAIVKANAILRVPPGKKTVLILGVGFEKKGAYQKKRERKPLKELVFFEWCGGKANKK